MRTPKVRQLLRFAGAMLGVLPVLAAAQTFTIAQTPPVLATTMPPNVILTLDDSGSMQWAFVPDAMDSGLSGSTPSLCAPSNTCSATRRAKSAKFNSLYYDPTVIYPAPIDPLGNALTTSFTQAPINGFSQGTYGPSSRGTVDLSTQYRPTWDYNPSSTSQTFGNHPNVAADLTAIGAATTTTPGKAYYYVFVSTNSGCGGSTDTGNDACYSIRIVGNQAGPVDVNGDGVIDGEDEKQNFANWYSFYRIRNLMAVSSASRTFKILPDAVRVAWQSLSSCNTFGSNCTGWSNPTVSNYIHAFDTGHRGDLYNWLFRLPANGSTPLRTAFKRAGTYYASKGDNSPYGFDPNQSPTVTGQPEYACRPNFHILMTDGVWNSDSGGFCYNPTNGTTVTCGNRDGSSTTLPDGTAYSLTSSLTKIYRDSNSDNLADIAFHYWSTDLRPDLANKLVPFYADRTGTADQQYWNPRNDPASWQHMVNFTIGIGLTSTLNVTSPVDIRWGGSTYAAPGFTNLGTTGSWPTTGTGASPGNVYDLWHAALNSRGQAFSSENPLQAEAAMQTALNRVLATAAASAALATNSTRLATGTLLFQAAFFSGDWTGTLKAIQVNPDGSIGSTLWNATDAGNIPGYNSRNIVSWSGTQGINFTKSDLQSAGLWSYINNDNLLNYLRGDSTNEIKNTGGVYRSRQTALGDIVNSDPVFVSAENYGYTDLPEGSAFSSTSYADFLTNTKQARRKMVYVGANDGMLHGFDALTGAERFAYVPKAVIPNMATLSDPFYAHHYFVDGPPGAWDAFIGGAWKTILVGTTGAGAKSVFALDITNPDAFGASNVMWEINDGTAQRSCDNGDPGYANDLGYTIGQGVTVKLNSGDWAVVFGNGYQSANNHAVLYVVRASDGCLLKKIDTGSGSSGNPNGLGTPTLWDADGDDVYDYIYAPDLRGKIWKFNLSGNSVGSWSIANSGQPLFKARNSSGTAEWTTARVELGPPPPGKTGVIVLFGTGRFFTDTDKGDTTQQSFYGIWDNGTPVTTTDRSELVQQTISTVTIDVGGVPTQVRTVTANTIDWNTKRGWYMDLPTSGERVIGTAAVRTGRVIFTTMFPSATDACDFGGGGWLMEVDSRTGGLLPYSVFDTTRNGTIDDNDSKIAGMPLTVGMVKQPLVIDGSPNAIKAMSGSSGQVQVERNRSFSKALGRDSWREVTR